MAFDNDYIKTENEENDVEDEELDEDNYKTQKDAILLAIEVSPSMLAPSSGSAGRKKGDHDSALAAALKCAHHLMQQRIISNPRDMMGVLLFGTRQYKYFEEPRDPAEPPYPHCYLLTDLDVPSAEDVRGIKTIVEESPVLAGDDDGIKVEGGGDDDDDVLHPVEKPRADTIHKMLFAANNVFATKAANFVSRRLFIITDNDDPTRGVKHDKDLAVIRAKDLYDIGASIELFPVSHSDRAFDTSKFYDDIIYKDAAAEANNAEIRVSKSGDGLSLLSSLISNVNSRQTAKRALFSNLALELAPGLTISVNGYNVFQRQAPQRSCYVWLDGDQPQLALGETTKISDDSAKTVERGELKKVYKFGGKFVYFSPDEQKELRTFGTPMIRVLGFKPRAAVPVWATVNKSTFIFPSEAGFVGSTRVFAALWQKLLRDDKVGIAWAVTRTNAAPRLVALVASREQADDESGTPYLPAGLWLYPLPFADDLRATPEPAASTTPYREPSDPLKDKMRVIVQQLQLPRAMYDPSKYPNPSLQWHYKILQALALQDEVPDKPDDATVPRYKAIAKRAGGYIEEYDALLRKEAGAGAMVVGRLKREAGVGDDDDDDVKPAKKVRKVLGDAGGGMGDGQMREAVRAGTVQKMTVVQLKEWLEARGMDTAGRKADLVARVTEWAG